MAWWEQRGAGLSYHPDIPAESMTVDQFIDDTITVAQYLCHRFEVERVHLMAHSWGSFIGLQAAARAPELFHSYIGMAQATHQIASEQEAYCFMLEAYRERGDHRMVRRLERSPVTGASRSPAATRSSATRPCIASESAPPTTWGRWSPGSSCPPWPHWTTPRPRR